MLKVNLLTTGDEILLGQIVDTNAAWLSDYFFQQGLLVHRHMTVGDDVDELIDAFNILSCDTDILVINGGLGPTVDDLTAKAIAQWLNEPLSERTEWVNTMQDYFAFRKRTMPKNNIKQAYLPISATILNNTVGTACGFKLRYQQCHIYCTPGVPSEFKNMIIQEIVPDIKIHFTNIEPLLCLRLTTFGCGESTLAAKIADLEIAEGIKIGYRPALSTVEIKLTALKSFEPIMQSTWQQVKNRLADHMLYEGDKGLASIIKENLSASNYQLAIQEVFTGGLLTYQLSSANVPLVSAAYTPNIRWEKLATAIQLAQTIAKQKNIHFAIVIGHIRDEYLDIALYAAGERFGVTLRCYPHYSHQALREIASMLSLDLLRRYLQNESVYVKYEMLDIIDTWQD